MNSRLKNLFDLRGLNFWLLASGIALNGIWTYMTLFFVLNALANNPGNPAVIQTAQLILLVSLFLSTFVVGFVLGKWAHDLRGPSYGVVCSLGSIGLVLYALLPSGGVIGLLAALVAAAGGFNGGVLSLPRPPAR